MLVMNAERTEDGLDSLIGGEYIKSRLSYKASAPLVSATLTFKESGLSQKGLKSSHFLYLFCI